MHPILATLPAPILALAERIERESSVPIEVVRSAPLHPDAALRDAEVACQIIPSERGLVAQIIRFNAEIKPEAALHELSHLEETLCKAIPQLTFSRGLETIENGYSLPGSYVGSAAWLENKISHHRYVYKRMKEMGYNQSEVLNRDLGEQWRQVAPVAKGAQSRIVPRMSMFLDYAITRRFCTDVNVRAFAGGVVASVGFTERVRRFDERLNKSRDKAEAVRVIIREFNIPEDMAILRSFDGPGKRIIDRDLAGNEVAHYAN